MDEKINFLGDLQRLEIKSGDNFVLMTKNHLSDDSVQRIQTMWAQFVGTDGPKLLVLDAGMTLGAIGLVTEPVIVSETKDPA